GRSTRRAKIGTPTVRYDGFHLAAITVFAMATASTTAKPARFILGNDSVTPSSNRRCLVAGNPLAGWDNFYVILGSSGAALTGLQFVVVALSAERRSAKVAAALDAFATPTIVHFGAVLLLAALITMPRHTFASLQTCLLLAGLGGLVYASYVLLQTRRQQSY